MELKNLLQQKENWEKAFGTQAANRSCVLSEGRSSHSSVSLAPLPSFLTKTPLGTPCEEMDGLKPMAEIPVRWEQKVSDSKGPLQRQVVEPTREAPKRLKQKTGQRKKPVKLNQEARTYGFIYRWIYEEVRLSMSKMSIMSLVLGLLFLGTLFFVIGFLAAVATIGSSPSGGGGGKPLSTWQASNEKKGSGKGFEHAVSSLGGGIIGKVVGHNIGSLGKVVGSSTVVPKSLQPFARYGMGKVGSEIRHDVRQVNPFVSRKRGRPVSPEQQPYGPQQPAGYQQYAPPYASQGAPQGQFQGQAYGPSPTALGYQQPAVVPPTAPQNGYQGYYPPPQQQMMQQPYYPQAVQQQAYQQPLPQPMMPQQQMMPGPQYQQQMPPQQGYYR